MMKKEAYNLGSCDKRVVQHVDAEVLGCCARSCGLNGHMCLLWPFFSPKEKVEWDPECCGEMSRADSSQHSGSLMCNLVLSDCLAKEASKYDLQEEDGSDVGNVLIGQNSPLVWNREGIKFQFPKKSKARRFISKLRNPFGKKEKAESTSREGDRVNMEFLIQHQKVGEEFLRLGFFREEPVNQSAKFSMRPLQ